jgi:hypothetical protein
MPAIGTDNLPECSFDGKSYDIRHFQLNDEVRKLYETYGSDFCIGTNPPYIPNSVQYIYNIKRKWLPNAKVLLFDSYASFVSFEKQFPNMVVPVFASYAWTDWKTSTEKTNFGILLCKIEPTNTTKFEVPSSLGVSVKVKVDLAPSYENSMFKHLIDTGKDKPKVKRLAHDVDFIPKMKMYDRYSNFGALDKVKAPSRKDERIPICEESYHKFKKLFEAMKKPENAFRSIAADEPLETL